LFSNPASASVPAPTDVLGFHNDSASTGDYLAETTLTPANVNPATFGKVFASALDGFVLAQPLYMADVSITTGSSPGVHNVAFVATEHNSVYALDAGNGAVLWQARLQHAVHGGTVTPVPAGDVHALLDGSTEIGITSTPVIDPATDTIYAVAFSKETATDGNHYIYQLYALDVGSGAQKFGGPAVIADSLGDSYVSGPTVPGSGDGSSSGTVFFDALPQDQRSALTLAKGSIYVTFASFNDTGPYHGWLLGYSAATLQLNAVFNDTPNGYAGGIWQSNGRIAADDQGNLYVETGNGTFDTTLTAPGGFPDLGDYGDSFLKLAVDSASSPTNPNINGWGLKVVDYFTPYDESALNAEDGDLGSGAPLLLPASAGSALHPELLVGSGKSGRIYLIDRNDMGHFDPAADHVVEETPNGTIGNPPPGIIGNDFSTAAYYNNTIYYVGQGGTAMTFSMSNGVLSTVPLTQSSDTYRVRGSTPSISADGNTNGIVWDIDVGTNRLLAYNAAGYDQELYDSGGDRDGLLGQALNFAVPTVAGGRVYVGASQGLTAYGLLLDLTPASLPPATAKAPYQQTITATGGATPYASLAALAFNPRTTGLSPPTVDAATGTLTIAGTPTGPGTAVFTVKAIDSAGAAFARTYRITVNPMLVMTPASPAEATAHAPYQLIITVLGGTKPYTQLSVTGFMADNTGLKVPTIDLKGATVDFNGTPLRAGTATFTVAATDTAGAVLMQKYTIKVNPPLDLSGGVSAVVRAGIAFTDAVVVTGGTRPLASMSVIDFQSGSTGVDAPRVDLAAGTVVVAGTALQSGTVAFAIKVTDGAGARLVRKCEIVVLRSRWSMLSFHDVSLDEPFSPQ
jgi:hypothetical protein